MGKTFKLAADESVKIEISEDNGDIDIHAVTPDGESVGLFWLSRDGDLRRFHLRKEAAEKVGVVLDETGHIRIAL